MLFCRKYLIFLLNYCNLKIFPGASVAKIATFSMSVCPLFLPYWQTCFCLHLVGRGQCLKSCPSSPSKLYLQPAQNKLPTAITKYNNIRKIRFAKGISWFIDGIFIFLQFYIKTVGNNLFMVFKCRSKWIFFFLYEQRGHIY